MALALTVAGFLAVAAPLQAGSASARMVVSVKVLARAVVHVAATGEIDVTEADLARGYVDVPFPITLEARTNSRAGYLLRATSSGSGFTAVQLSFAGTTMEVRDRESWIRRPYVAGGERLNISARLRLGPATVAGRYPLPVTFSADPL